MGGDHRHRALPVAPVEGLVEVGLLRLGRKSRGRTASLDIDDHKRKLGHHGESHGFRLQRKSRPRSGGHRKVARERGTDGSTDSGNLVLCLQCLGSKALVDREFLKYGSGRRDRIRTAEKRQPRLLGSGQKPPGGGLVAGDVAVRTLGEVLHRLHGVGVGYYLEVGRVVEAVFEDFLVRFYDLRMFL